MPKPNRAIANARRTNVLVDEYSTTMGREHARAIQAAWIAGTEWRSTMEKLIESEGLDGVK